MDLRIPLIGGTNVCANAFAVSESFAELAQKISAVQPNEPYSAMVKKRNAALAHGIVDGAMEYVSSSPRNLSVHRLPFVSAAEYARNVASEFVLLEAGTDRYTLEPARTIGDNDAIPLHGCARAMYIARVDDAVVESLSYILRVDGVAIGDFENQERNRFDDCPELDAGIFAIDEDEVLVIDDGDAPELTIDEAFVSLLGPHSLAFGHWIWHQLPRIIVALERGHLKNMPILIECGMPATHRQALELIIGDRQMPIIEVPFFGRVRVKHAWYVPMPFLMPYCPIPNERWRWDFIGPSPARFQPILESMHRSIAKVTAFDHSIRGGRVFLTRGKGLYRVLRNGFEIEEIFRRFGFTIVDPVKLTFAEQASLMASADIVAGPEGSAMFLNFYRRPETRLLILSHPYTRHLTNWTATLDARSVEVTIVTGPVVPMTDEELPPAARFGYNYFVDYEIDPARLIEVLRVLESA